MKSFWIVLLSLVAATSTAYAADRKCKKIAKLGQLELTLQTSKIKRGADNVDVAIKKLAKAIGKGVELKTGLVQVTRKGFPNEITPLSNLWSRISFDADTMEIKVKYSAQYGNSDAWIDDQVIAFRGGKRPSLFINQVGGYNNQGDGLIEIINLVEVVGNTVTIRYIEDKIRKELKFEFNDERVFVIQTESFRLGGVNAKQDLTLSGDFKK